MYSARRHCAAKENGKRIFWEESSLIKENKRTIQAVDKAFEVIKCFEDHEELGVTEISKKLDIHKSTTFGLISTLSANGILEKNNNTGKYRLGLELYRLGTKVNVNLKNLVFPYLEEVANNYQETANLVILKDASVMYLEKVEGSHSMRISTLVGGEKPIHCTAVGKAMLAFLNEKDLEKTIKKIEFNKYTPNTILDERSLRKALEKIRTRGYAEDCEELEVGLRCIAAPIFNQYKVPFAAISVSGPATRMDDKLSLEIAGVLIDFANRISRKLGYIN